MASSDGQLVTAARPTPGAPHRSGMLASWLGGACAPHLKLGHFGEMLLVGGKAIGVTGVGWEAHCSAACGPGVSKCADVSVRHSATDV